MKVVIPGFIKGLVDESTMSAISEDRLLKASKLTNFYQQKNKNTARRPPVELWEDTNIPANEQSGLVDYIKIDDVEYYMRGPTVVLDELLVPQILTGLGVLSFEKTGNIGTDVSYEIDYRIIANTAYSEKHLFISVKLKYISTDVENTVIIYSNSLDLANMDDANIDGESTLTQPVLNSGVYETVFENARPFPAVDYHSNLITKSLGRFNSGQRIYIRS